MAKKRRIIRTLNTGGRGGFESQLWSIYVALILLGGFLIGTAASLLRFDDARWYANAWTWVILTPLVVGGVMIALPYIENRFIKRATQFSLILGLIFLSVLLIVMDQTNVLALFWEDPEPKDPKLAPVKVVTPEYHPIQIPRDEQSLTEFERPNDTPTPEPEKKDPPKEKTPPKPIPPKPQNKPVPQKEPTPQPKAVNKRQDAQATPRFSKQASKLSRRQNQARPQSALTSDIEQPTQPSARTDVSVNAQSQTVNKQQPNAKIPERNRTPEPTATANSQNVQISRQENKRTEQPESPTASALKRQIAKVDLTPQTQVRTTDSPAAAQQTAPQQPKPNTLAAQKQATASPQASPTMTQAALPNPTANAAIAQRRELPSPTKPTPSQTPNTTPSRRPVTNIKPNLPTLTDVAQPNRAPADVSRPPTTQQPRTTTVKRTPSELPLQPRAVASRLTPTTPSPVSSPTAQRATRQPDITAPSPTATATPRRTPTTTGVQTTAVPTTTAGQVANSSRPQQTAARSTNVTKQSTSNSAVAKASDQPSPVASANSPTPTRNNTSTRQPRAVQAPTIVQNRLSVPKRRTQQQVLPSDATVATTSQTNQATNTSQTPQPRPSNASISRQPTIQSAANLNRPTSDVPSASPTTQIARPTVNRATTTPRPSVDPTAPASQSPRRSTRLAQATTSPTTVESPSLSQTPTTADSQSQAQPAKISLNKATTGTAGSGQSPNLDRGSGAPDSPAPSAADSARRERATQNSPTGPALAPSEAATVRRSRAAEMTPSSTLVATADTSAPAAGEQRPSEIAATSSAQLTSSRSNADSGPVSASKGNVEIDRGSPRVVSEGRAGRASGGGQPQLNFESPTNRLARSDAGGAPQTSLAADTVAAEVAAPAGSSGGRPPTPTPNVDATAAVRTDPGDNQPVSGGPSLASQQGPTAEVSTAQQLASASASRAEASESAPGDPASGGGNPDDEEDEEEKAKRLARAALAAAPSLSLDGPITVDLAPTGTPGEAGSPTSQTQPTKLAAQRAATGGAPAASPSTAAQTGPLADTGGGQPAEQSQRSRSEMVAASAGPTTSGGGTASPARSARGPAFVANTRAETSTLSGSPNSSGNRQGVPLEASSLTVKKQTGGAVANAARQGTGAAQGTTSLDAPSNSTASSAAGQRASSSTANGPQAITASTSGAPLKRATIAALPVGGAAGVNVELPQVGPSAPKSEAIVSALAGGGDVGPMSRQATGGLEIDIPAEAGPGGLADQYTVSAGINNRQAQSDSPRVLQTADTRFLRKATGGRPDFNTSAVLPAEPFRGRTSRKEGKEPGGRTGGPSPQTEEAIELGLLFLSRHQSPDGNWTLNNFGRGRPGYENERASLHSDTAATGLALLAFQGAGYTHREHRYQEAVRRGINWLVSHQKKNGDLYFQEDEDSNRAVWLYSHSIAALALCEAYGMTQDPALRKPAQKALDFIIASQHKDRGGWRYSPNTSSDTSVTGWMMMALKSGELANLDVPPDVYKKIKRWLDSAQASKTQRHMYRYNPQAPNTTSQRHGRRPTHTMTSVGLLMRLYSGWRRDHADMIKGADYLLTRPPAIGTPRDPQRDTYYWYYATQVMFHMGGDQWKQWYDKLHPILTDTQIQTGAMAGSWNPRGPVPDRWAPHAGRIYVTAMNLLSLEVFYRVLPLYDDTAK